MFGKDFGDKKIKLNGYIKVINADIQASNGIIHAIDNVLLPPSDIVTAVSGVEKFSTLVSLLVQADLVATLSNDGPFTVFAPTNEAFAKLENLEDLTTNDLKNILLYHVVSDNLPYAALASEDDTQELETLLGAQTINVIVSRWVWWKIKGIKGDDNKSKSKILKKNIVAANGFIHAIDRVLLPNLPSRNDFSNESITSIIPTSSPGLRKG